MLCNEETCGRRRCRALILRTKGNRKVGAGRGEGGRGGEKKGGRGGVGENIMIGFFLRAG